MVQCETVVNPFPAHWSYCSLAPSIFSTDASTVTGFEQFLRVFHIFLILILRTENRELSPPPPPRYLYMFCSALPSETSQHSGCSWPVAYLVPGHLQAPWPRMPVDACQLRPNAMAVPGCTPSNVVCIEAEWRIRATPFRPSLVHAMVCCVPIHYLNQYRLIVNWITWNKSQRNLPQNTTFINLIIPSA